MQEFEKNFEIESRRQKRKHIEESKARIEKNKWQTKETKEQNLSKSHSHKASRWKTLLVTALTLATTHFAKAQQEPSAQDPDTVKTEQTANKPQTPAKNNDTGLRAAAAELAMDVDFMSNFLIEEGENTLSNFNMRNITLTEDVADGIEAGEQSTKLNRYALTTNYGNSDGRHCYRGTKNILSKNGISLEGSHAYEAVEQLRNLPQFTEIKCDYSMLGYLPGGTVVVQGKGTTASGHIFVIGEQNGKKVQKCGRTYQLPTSNRRGSSGQHYDGLYVFVPSDCKLSLDATADLYSKGCFKTSPEDFLLPILENDPELIKVTNAPAITKEAPQQEDGKETCYAEPAKNGNENSTFYQSLLRLNKNRSYDA